MTRTGLIIALALSGCAPVPQKQMPLPQAQMAATGAGRSVAEMKRFPPRAAARPTRANRDIATDFLDLAFRMESGRELARLTRFDGPITVRLTGRSTPQMQRDLEALLARMRAEAGLDIQMTRSPGAAITVEAVPRAALHAAVPKAACFVVPRVSGWTAYLAQRRTPHLDWTTLERRDRASVFLPSDAAPQEARDCLHEELAQALGPLNDLYRLPDSVFNDDNMHAVLTGFDMLVLRVFYAPELRNGMSRGEVAARLPAILARLNPAGEHLPARPESDTPRQWITAMETALGGSATPAARRNAARRALIIGQAARWGGPRQGFASYVYGRLHLASDPDPALRAFRAADRAYAARPETRLHRAYVAVQLASVALAAGRSDQVLALVTPAIANAERAENAALLATLMMFRAEALDLQGRSVEAQAVRLDSLGWARYGFGSDANVQARLREIRALAPRR